MKDYIIGILLAFALSGCYYDNEEDLYPPGTGPACDTLVTTYSARIRPLLEKRCYSCHNQAAAPSSGGGWNLESHAVVKGLVDNGRLMGAIKHQNGFVPMPKDARKLSDCEIAIIQRWVNNGAKNN